MPWWAPPQRLDRRQATVLATLAALVAVQGFLGGLLPETLTYASSEMHFGTFGQGVVFASVELAALPALGALALADRKGRRSVVLWATAGAAALSELGTFAPDIAWLATTQVAAGALLAAASIAAVVVAVEEVPPGCRAWAVGALGMAGGFGGGARLCYCPSLVLDQEVGAGSIWRACSACRSSRSVLNNYLKAGAGCRREPGGSRVGGSRVGRRGVGLWERLQAPRLRGPPSAPVR